MANLALCAQCKRTNRYATKDTDKICAKCKATRLKPKDDEPKEEIVEAVAGK